MRELIKNEEASAIPVLLYIFGFLVFGFTYWLLNGVKLMLDNVAPTGNLTLLFNMLWTGIIFVYMIFGGFWLMKQYRKREVFG